MSKKKIIIDTDPGYDDAYAITFAALCDKFDLLAITTVAGNQTIDLVTENALKLARFLNLKCPVAKGMSSPLLKPLEVAKVHGKTGLDNVDLTPEKESPEIKLCPKNAVELIIDLCLKNEDVYIITIGPMTNIAMALKLEPKIKEHIKEIVSMGGSMLFGNVTPAAEFNIHQDPESAYIVYNSGVPVKMNGLDVTMQTMCNEKILERINKINTKESKLFFECMSNCNKFINDLIHVPYGAAHDLVAVVSVFDENVVTYKNMYVEVDISRGSSYGRTNCDQFDTQKKNKNAFVGVSIDTERFWNDVENVYKTGRPINK